MRHDVCAVNSEILRFAQDDKVVVFMNLPTSNRPTNLLQCEPMNDVFTEVLRVTDLPVGRIKAVKVEDRSVAISRTSSGFFATDNTCPHRGGPLAEGDMIGNEIIFVPGISGDSTSAPALPGTRGVHHRDARGKTRW